jgi:hypothetical protein
MSPDVILSCLDRGGHAEAALEQILVRRHRLVSQGRQRDGQVGQDCWTVETPCKFDGCEFHKPSITDSQSRFEELG